MSKMFDYNGGELSIEEHSIKVTVPIGAIIEGHKVQIEAAASLFGPFIIPDGYHPISAYVWIGTCSKFIKKPLKVEIEHNIVVSEETKISELHILTASEKDFCGEKAGQKMFKMKKDTFNYQCQINDTTFTVFSDHFCYKCLAIKENTNIPKRVMMYHYLPENYKSKKVFQAEVCFCYDLTFCKQVH